MLKILITFFNLLLFTMASEGSWEGDTIRSFTSEKDHRESRLRKLRRSGYKRKVHPPRRIHKYNPAIHHLHNRYPRSASKHITPPRGKLWCEFVCRAKRGTKDGAYYSSALNASIAAQRNPYEIMLPQRAKHCFRCYPLKRSINYVYNFLRVVATNTTPQNYHYFENTPELDFYMRRLNASSLSDLRKEVFEARNRKGTFGERIVGSKSKLVYALTVLSGIVSIVALAL